MEATPREGEATIGGEPQGGVRGLLSTDANWPGTPFVARQADGVAHAEVWRRIFIHLNQQIITFSSEITF